MPTTGLAPFGLLALARSTSAVFHAGDCPPRAEMHCGTLPQAFDHADLGYVDGHVMFRSLQPE